MTTHQPPAPTPGTPPGTTFEGVDGDVPVLVVGAGPAGLVTALVLARCGVRTLVVDRRTSISAEPKATVLSTRTMELMRHWDLAEAARAGGHEVEWRMLLAPTLAAAGAGHDVQLVEVGLPTPVQAALLSPERPALVPQDHFEAVLHRRLAEVGVPVLRGVAVVSVGAGDTGAAAVLRDVASGAERRVSARYLVGADGVHGTVRRALGITARGVDVLHESLGVSFHAPLWDVVGDRRYGLYVTTDPAAEGVFLPAGPPDRWYWAVDWDARTAPGTIPAVADIAERIRAGAGVPDLPVRIVRAGRVTYGTNVADTFRHGAAFLVGDAAHRISPRGGTGLNMAVHDGADLGWKLAWVLGGLAAEELLDTYEAERRPPAVHNAARSEHPDGSRRSAATELPVDLGGRITHLPLPGGGSTLDLPGPGLALLTGPAAAPWREAAGRAPGTVPVAVHDLDPVTARALGIAPRGAVLVRPDGVPVALLRQPADLPEAVATATATGSKAPALAG